MQLLMKNNKSEQPRENSKSIEQTLTDVKSMNGIEFISKKRFVKKIRREL